MKNTMPGEVREGRMKAALNNDYAVFILDRTGHICQCEGAVRPLCNRSRNELITRHVSTVFPSVYFRHFDDAQQQEDDAGDALADDPLESRLYHSINHQPCHISMVKLRNNSETYRVLMAVRFPSQRRFRLGLWLE